MRTGASKTRRTGPILEGPQGSDDHFLSGPLTDMPTTESIPAIEPRSSSRRLSRRLGRRLVFGLFWAGIVGMGAWNGRYLWVHRPLPDLKEVHRLIARHQDREAEAMLRARLSQSPHEVASRILLARLLGTGETAEAATQLRAVPYWWSDKADCLYREGQAWMSIDRTETPGHGLPTSRTIRIIRSKSRLGEVESELINLYGDQNRWPEARDIVWRSYDRVTTPAGKRELTMMALRTHIERIATEHALPASGTTSRPIPPTCNRESPWPSRRRKQAKGASPTRPWRLAWRPGPIIPMCTACTSRFSRRGDSPELEALLKHPPDSYKTLPLYWHLIGTRAFDKEQWEAAVAAYREAVRLAPSQSEDLYKLAMAEKRWATRPRRKFISRSTRRCARPVPN